MGPTPVYGARAEKLPQNADFAMKQTNICRLSGDITRMVQLPATAAIEYVAACWVPGAGGFLSGVLLSGGPMPVPPKFNAYRHRLGFLCLAS